MAKSKETLIKEITAESEKKGVQFSDLEGKSVLELETALTDLQNRTAPPPPGANDQDDDPEPDEKPVFEYSVAPGKAITTKRGILADGEEITKKDIPEDAFKSFLKSGQIKKG